jgi:perosamine synthetase
LLCGSGSLALELALRSCGVGKGDEVVISTFCCTAVVPPILAVGAVPVLADVGAELNLTAEMVDAVLTKKTKAIVVAHLFGNPADIHTIVDLVRGKKIHVIDDAAQALGATIDGQPVGSFGDVGIVSFGREKICSGLGGGAVVAGNSGLTARIAKILPTPSGMRALFECLLTLFSQGLRGWSLPLRNGFSRSPLDGPDTPPAIYRREAMANLNAAVAVSLLQTLRENINARRARVRAYHELLSGTQRLELIGHRNGSACLTQVVRVLPDPNDDLAARVIAELGKEGYKVHGSYVPIHLLPRYEQCVWDRLSRAERVWPDLIELPCEPSVGLDHVQRIAGIVKDSLND